MAEEIPGIGGSPGREPVALRGITLVPRHGTPVRIRSRLVSGGGRPRSQSATSPR